ncbi:MAG TPA: hypothetical protein VGN23_07650 [Verrucomicrobiae bacterium]|jgi:di/tricarboxylate transporter
MGETFPKSLSDPQSQPDSLGKKSREFYNKIEDADSSIRTLSVFAKIFLFLSVIIAIASVVTFMNQSTTDISNSPPFAWILAGISSSLFILSMILFLFAHLVKIRRAITENTLESISRR